jgi:hypothetical protein
METVVAMHIPCVHFPVHWTAGALYQKAAGVLIDEGLGKTVSILPFALPSSMTKCSLKESLSAYCIFPGY